MMRKNERGAALIEMAIITPLLIMLFVGIIDFGDAWFRNASAQNGVRAASVIGFDAGDDHDHDLRVLRSVVNELSNRNIENIEFVTIYDADVHEGPPSGCTGGSGVTGVNNTCVVYGAGYLDKIFEADRADDFVPGDCSASIDRLWCAQSRAGTDESWSVGVYVKAKQETLSGVMPGFDSYVIEKKAVIRERRRG